MQDQPTETELLRAIGEFLTRDLMPVVTDRGLRFRTLIAANLLDIVRREIEGSTADYQSEIDRLKALLPEAVTPELTALADPAARRRAVEHLNEALVHKLRSGEVDGVPEGVVWAHVRQTLVDKLAVANPRFDPNAPIS